jgi:serine/threonine protein kinase
LNHRTAKVSKSTYSDHGDHHKLHKSPSHKGNVLKKMTMNAIELFRSWESDTIAAAARGRKKRSSPSSTNKQQQQHQQQDQQQQQQQQDQQHQQDQQSPADLSPQRFSFSQLALDSTGKQKQQQQSTQQQQSHHSAHLPEHLFSGSMNNSASNLSHKPGHLSSVIENASLASSRTHGLGVKGGGEGSVSSRGSSIATKSSMGTRTSVCSSFRTLPQGKCLTQPSEPVSNEGLDNADGNLIAHENDSISVDRKQIHVLTRDKLRNAKHADFRIQNLLGQGTFAQVFQCLHLQTGNLVAVKIVKNKPAYTRQSAVEIDVFRALTTPTTTKKQETGGASVSSSSSTSQKGGSLSVSSATNSTSDHGGVASSEGAGGDTKWDFMVNLVCYFMYKDHLCLVFELLGLNLYEVLKKRQFRGLPLPMVRSVVKQAVGGVKELAKKSIVHCDLKPENILLVTDGDVDSAIGAGESKRLASDSPGKNKNKDRLSASFDKKQMGELPIMAAGMAQVMEGNPALTRTQVDAISQSPTFSMGTAVTTGTQGLSNGGQKIKLIDFGSACFEGQTAHTYIQSRFYRSPEVLVGLAYDSAIDMWSLGCVAAELFLGLPILPGVHEHDQLGRISEMVSKPPDWMLEQGSKSSKYFVKYVQRDGPTPPPSTPPPGTTGGNTTTSLPRPLPQWRIRTQQEYISSLSPSEIRKKGGLAKLEKQPANRYFKRKKLADIVLHKGQNGRTPEDNEQLELFIHFLYGKQY